VRGRPRFYFYRSSSDTFPPFELLYAWARLPVRNLWCTLRSFQRSLSCSDVLSTLPRLSKIFPPSFVVFFPSIFTHGLDFATNRIWLRGVLQSSLSFLAVPYSRVQPSGGLYRVPPRYLDQRKLFRILTSLPRPLTHENVSVPSPTAMPV